MSKTPLELVGQHVRKWTGCTQCELGAMREGSKDHMVFGRGNVPAEVLFVGEAPGESESSNRTPFDGPAGKLLDEVIRIAKLSVDFDHNLTNLVCCIPRDTSGAKIVPPKHEHVMACKPRLEEYIKVVGPSLVVCVGKEAWDYLRPDPSGDGVRVPKGCHVIQITHPAAILRARNPVVKESWAFSTSVDLVNEIGYCRKYRRGDG